MNQQYFATNWPWLRHRVRAHWPQLSEADLEHINGRVERLYAVLLECGGLRWPQAAHELWDFLRRGEETC
jgi:hypothetical protein